MKRLLTVLLAAGMVALSACSSAGGTATSAGSASSAAPASKGDYPSKQVNLIIQAAAGGESDSTGRLIAQTMEQKLGVPVVCSNKTGASGAVAFQYVRTQKADGYTIGICPAEISMVHALGLSDVQPSDMDFLGGACETPSAIIVSGKAPYKTLKEFVDYCKSNPGKVVDATSGAGSTMHVGSEVFAQKTGIQLSYTPYDGSGPALTAVMGRHADVAVIGVMAASAGVASGDLRILGILGDERSSTYPDIPTAKEQGFDVTYTTWVGLYAPKGLPADVKTTLETAVKAGVEAQPYTKFAKERGLTVKYRSADEFTKFVDENFKMYEEMIPKLGIK